MFYMKSLAADGSFNVIALDAQGKSGDEVLKDEFIAKGYAESSEEEYNSQISAAVAVEPAGDVAVEATEGTAVEAEIPVEEVAA